MVCRRSRQPPGSLPWLRAMRLSRYAGRRPGGRTPRGFAVSRGEAGLCGLHVRGLQLGESVLENGSCLPKKLGLPRKEVIQPHLPVRLPCYDFTPLTLHTFDASAPFGFGRRLRVQTTRVV